MKTVYLLVTFTVFSFISFQSELLSEEPHLSLSLDEKEVEAVTDREHDIEEMIEHPPVVENDEGSAAAKKGSLLPVEKVVVELSEEGEPIIGYRFVDKSEGAKIADRERSLEEGTAESDEEGFTGTIKHGKIQ